jgi:hypothetical protein
MRFKIKPPSNAPPKAAQKLRVKAGEENDEGEAREEGTDDVVAIAGLTSGQGPTKGRLTRKALGCDSEVTTTARFWVLWSAVPRKSEYGNWADHVRPDQLCVHGAEGLTNSGVSKNTIKRLPTHSGGSALSVKSKCVSWGEKWLGVDEVDEAEMVNS